MITLKWKTDEMTGVPFTLAKRDYPYEVSKYFLIIMLVLQMAMYSTSHFTQWAHGFKCACNHAVHCLLC